MSTPLIDVLIPVYNGEATVREAIASIQRQTLSDFRMIVVDDGSTDATPNILAEIAASDSRVHVLRQPNGGIVDALNAGLARCEAEFIARHDADDLAEPFRFERQIAYLQAHPDCIAVSNAVRHIDAAGKRLGSVEVFGSPDDADPTCVPSKEPYLLHPFLTVRRASVEQVGGYRYVFHAEDTDLYWRLREIGRLHNVTEVLGDYRVHAQSISSRSVNNGRIAALFSQLAGLSAMRRQAGRPDFVFTKQAIQPLNEAQSLADVYRLGSEGLDDEERKRLEISLCAKMLETTAYRPYELNKHDCVFIGNVFRRHTWLDAYNRKIVGWHVADTAARLVCKGKLAEARALLSPPLYRVALMRLLFRLVPKGGREWLRSLRGKQGISG